MANQYGTSRLGDRREGRLIRTLPAFNRITPYIQPKRSDAQCVLTDTIEVSNIENWLREKRNDGWDKLGFLHLIIAAYVRTVSMRPGINRFVANNKIYARNDIQVIFIIKRSPSVSGSETSIKLSFAPTDTVMDICNRITTAIDEEKADITISDPERIANTLMKIPGFALKWAMGIIKALDRHDHLPEGWLNASPYHGSVLVSDMGSLGIVPAAIHLPDFGTLPLSISFGARRRVQIPNTTAVGGEEHYVDLAMACDERIADSYYFASALKCLKYFLKNPHLLELPPEKTDDDIN